MLHNLITVENVAGKLEFQLNRVKCVVICFNPVTFGKFICASPGFRVVNPEVVTLLGSPIGSMEGIEALIIAQINRLCLKFMGSSLRHLSTHDSFSLHQNAFGIPKLVYSLQSSPCFFLHETSLVCLSSVLHPEWDNQHSSQCP